MSKSCGKTEASGKVSEHACNESVRVRRVVCLVPNQAATLQSEDGVSSTSPP